MLEPASSTLRGLERGAIQQLKKWLLIDESITRQKSRVKWLQLGDSNLSYCKSTLQAIDIAVVRHGRALNELQRQELVREVHNSEIDYALRSIHKESAPDPDGLNSLFFWKVWSLIHEDIYQAIKMFFEIPVMVKDVNCTSITLFPKSLHVTSIKQYRLISCCNVLYKLISKVLTKRLRSDRGCC